MITVDIKSLLSRLNASCNQTLEAAAGACLSRAHYEVTIEHVLAKLLESPQNDLALILSHFSCDPIHWGRAVENSLEGLRVGNSGKPVFSPLFLEWLQEAWLISSVDWNETFVRSGALLSALLAKPERFAGSGLAGLLCAIPRETLQMRFFDIVKGSTEATASGEKAGHDTQARIGTSLEKYCVDFTRQAEADQIDPVFGRDREMYQMIDILTRRRKNNPILVGEAGVGKTAAVEGLARRIVKGDVPDSLQGVSILGLDMGLLQAGAGMKGEFEHRLKSIIQEITSSPKPLILFIDEAHTLIGAGGTAGGSDAANLLKPALARGELRTIAATTWSEYKKYFEKDAALARRFQPVKLEEPSVEEAVRILRGLKSRYEEAHGITVRDSAIVAAAEYSSRYISGRQLPDKAVDLLDTSAARVKGLLTAKPAPLEDKEREIECLDREKKGLERDVLHGADPQAERLAEIEKTLTLLRQETEQLGERWRKEKESAHRLIALRKTLVELAARGDSASLSDLKNEIAQAAEALKTLQSDHPLVPTEVDPDIVAKVVSDWTGIPLGRVLRDEAGTIAALETSLSKRIKGQDAAVVKICQALRASKIGLKEPHQPLGVFLLVGPSGVGKTETALAIADLLFGGERFLHTINMSEFRESHSVSRLIGSPPGYVGYGEGGLLTEAVRQKPYSVVLIDEAEKGHLDVMNLFYQVFDKGVLADAEGRIVDFKNTVIFLTSNLASEAILRLSAGGMPFSDQVLETIRPMLSHHFKPALLARMTVVPYYPLEAKHLKDIILLKLDRLSARLLNTHKIKLTYSEAVVDQMAARCLEVETGARRIDHLLGASILPQLSREIVSHMGNGESLSDMHLGLNDDGLFSVHPHPPTS